MKAGFFQFAPVFGRKDENIKKVVSVLKETDADLLVLPEFFATGYQFISKDEVAELSEQIPNGFTTELLSEISHQRRFYIVAGLPERDGDRFFNSAVLTGPEGFIGAYRKTHLCFEEKLFFSPGNTGYKVWDTKIGHIGVMICFDWFFPEYVAVLRALVDPWADSTVTQVQAVQRCGAVDPANRVAHAGVDAFKLILAPRLLAVSRHLAHS